MASQTAITECMALLRALYPAFVASEAAIEAWGLILGEGVSDVELREAVTEWARSPMEFGPRPGQLRHAILVKRDWTLGATAEQIADAVQADPVARALAIRSGFLRRGESYGDDPPYFYAPSRESDPVGYATALKSLRAEMASMQANPETLPALRDAGERAALPRGSTTATPAIVQELADEMEAPGGELE